MAVVANRRTTTHHRRPQRTPQRVREIIGRAVLGSAQLSLYQSRGVVSVDETIPDYAFYDKLRRGKQPGYKLGALFAKRIERVLAAWVFGEGIEITINKDIAADYPKEGVEYTNAQIKNFVDGLLDSGQDNEGDNPDFDDQTGALLLTIFEDAVGLGDQYIIVNADGSLSVPSPDTVEVDRDPLDYRLMLAVRITTHLPKGVTVTDEYRANGRTLTIKQMIDSKIVEKVERFENLIGRIQVVHVAHGRSGNETNGHSIHEDLLKLYDQYDNVIHKQIDGAVLLGNPILAIEGLEDLAAVIDANKPATPATYTDQDGAEVTRPELNIDSASILLIGKGGSAGFVAPPVGFTADTQQALKTLFLLLLDRTGIPESIWGNELSSGRSSSETQMSQFVKELRGWQKANGGWVVRLCKIWLQFRALTDPKLIVEKLSAKWPAAVEEDKALVLKFIEVALNHDLLTPETALKLMSLVEEAEKEAQAAQELAKARADDEQQRVIAQANAMPKPTVGGAVRQMNGYTEREATAIVAGAIRTLAGEG